MVRFGEKGGVLLHLFICSTSSNFKTLKKKRSKLPLVAPISLDRSTFLSVPSQINDLPLPTVKKSFANSSLLVGEYIAKSISS